MEVVAVQPKATLPTQGGYSPKAARQASDALILTKTLSLGSKSSDAKVSEVFKALTVTAKEVVEKLNEILKASLPEGLQSLSPDEVTPEATAERIVSGATSYFDVFARQNPGLQGEELLNRFLSTIRGGINRGYGEAVEILEGLGAFEFEGVKSGVEKTRVLVDEKLAAFEAFKRKELGLPGTNTEESVAETTATQVATLAGSTVARVSGLNVTA